jgi:hypothetical protein
MTYCALFPQRQQQLHDGDGNWAAENLAPPRPDPMRQHLVVDSD